VLCIWFKDRILCGSSLFVFRYRIGLKILSDDFQLRVGNVVASGGYASFDVKARVKDIATSFRGLFLLSKCDDNTLLTNCDRLLSALDETSIGFYCDARYLVQS